jgi:Domain of unknown function (DUF4150)
MSVFANGLEVSGKATPNKTIAAMPDVCMSPPPPPAGPVPIPYPNFGMASDTTDGCTSVFAMGKEAGKKNASKYSKITGNEPATNSFGAGVVSHKITGPLKFAAYSFDVIFEGGGAERFTDLTTTNHMNNTNGGTNISAAPPSVATPAPPPDCAAMRAELNADRAAVQQNVDAGTPGFQSQSLATNAQCGTLASASSSGAMSYGCSNQLLADRAQRVSGRAYPTPTQPGYQAYAPTPSSACNGNPPIQHATGRHSRHAEMNILNKMDWVNNPPKVITFCISYPAAGPNGGQPDCPCPNCQNTINQVCACVEQIYICDENNNPQPQCPP